MTDETAFPPITRRRAVSLLAMTLAAPALAQGAGFATRAAGFDQLHSLVVRQGGTEVFARGFRGPGPDRIANVKSVSKTVLALLTGIAIDRGHLPGIETRVLPALGRPEAGDARDRLTVAHLLSMQTGLDSVSGRNYGAWVSSRDWVDAALAQDLVDRPGGRFIYSTGGWHVLGALLSRATGKSLLEMTRDWLGAPLDLGVAPWVRDPQGRFLGGNDMGLTPRGLARIGQTVLDGGVHEGKQIVPERWIETSWQPRARSPWSGDSYGFGWFLTEFDGAMAAYGRGYGGQMLAVIPSRGVVVAITSDPTRPARSGGYFGDLRALVTQITAEL
jgi:CubicO group peptidase (beta-lactamase class C family)